MFYKKIEIYVDGSLYNEYYDKHVNSSTGSPFYVDDLKWTVTKMVRSKEPNELLKIHLKEGFPV